MNKADVTIIRDFQTTEVTLGKLFIRNSHECETLEEPYRANKRNISSIPVGLYVCKRRYSLKYGTHFHVTDVQNRSLILIHWGNTVVDTEGCILLGRTRGRLTKNGQRLDAVLSSRLAFKDFMRKMQNYKQFVLEIKVA